MAADKTSEEWLMLQKWYCHNEAWTSSPMKEGLDEVTAEQEDLYRQPATEGEQIPVLVQLEVVPDVLPREEKILAALWSLHAGRVGC